MEELELVRGVHAAVLEEEIGAARVPAAPLRDVVHLAVHRHPAVLLRRVARQLLGRHQAAIARSRRRVRFRSRRRARSRSGRLPVCSVRLLMLLLRLAFSRALAISSFERGRRWWEEPGLGEQNGADARDDGGSARDDGIVGKAPRDPRARIGASRLKRRAQRPRLPVANCVREALPNRAAIPARRLPQEEQPRGDLQRDAAAYGQQQLHRERGGVPVVPASKDDVAAEDGEVGADARRHERPGFILVRRARDDHLAGEADEHAREEPRLHGDNWLVQVGVGANGDAEEHGRLGGRARGEGVPVGARVEDAVLQHLAGAPRGRPDGDERRGAEQRAAGEAG
mmetsp:Transcript_46578/g.101205  ORF Transcript_46578/g.101205 Transcript_46578/m.101205 type:complete len:341 (-) Transcript_46578:1187-2209(-)